MSGATPDGSVWRRPADMAKCDFERFAREAEAAVGAEHADLVAAIAADLAKPDPDSPVLALDADAAAAAAREWARRRGGEGERAGRLTACYLRHLAYRHELAYRALHGPAVWERKVDVVPCPDFLPCGPHQVRQSRMGLYRAAQRTGSIAFIAAFAGAFPFLVLPAAARLFSWRIMSASWSRASIGCWCAAAAAALCGHAVARALRGRRARS